MKYNITDVAVLSVLLNAIQQSYPESGADFLGSLRPKFQEDFINDLFNDMKQAGEDFDVYADVGEELFKQTEVYMDKLYTEWKGESDGK